MGKHFHIGGRQSLGRELAPPRSSMVPVHSSRPNPLLESCRAGVGEYLLYRPQRSTRGPPQSSFRATTLATTFGRLAPSGTRVNISDSFKSNRHVENKRHTNAHHPLTSPSPIGATIPPSPPDSCQHWS